MSIWRMGANPRMDWGNANNTEKVTRTAELIIMKPVEGAVSGIATGMIKDLPKGKPAPDGTQLTRMAIGATLKTGGAVVRDVYDTVVGNGRKSDITENPIKGRIGQ